jgi:hypothetical protein
MAGKGPQTNAELIRALSEAFDSVPPESLEEASEELSSIGVDPEQVARRLGEYARETLKRSPLNWRVRAEEQRTQALARLRALAPTQKPRHELESAIREILVHGNAEARTAAQAFFHKYQGRASDSDLASLLAQLEFLDVMRREKK